VITKDSSAKQTYRSLQDSNTIFSKLDDIADNSAEGQVLFYGCQLNKKTYKFAFKITKWDQKQKQTQMQMFNHVVQKQTKYSEYGVAIPIYFVFVCSLGAAMIMPKADCTLAQLATSIRNHNRTDIGGSHKDEVFEKIRSFPQFREEDNFIVLKQEIKSKLEAKYQTLVRYGVTHQDLHAANIAIVFSDSKLNVYILDWDDSFEMREEFDRLNEMVQTYILKNTKQISRIKKSSISLQHKKKQIQLLEAEISKFTSNTRDELNNWRDAQIQFMRLGIERYIIWDILFTELDTFQQPI
jgi:hypothetical protein